MKRVFIVCALILGLRPVFAQSPISMGDKIAYVDSQGKVINQGMFKRGTAFSEGLAAVDVSQEGQIPKWFFIGTDFSVKIPFGYDTVGQFNEGLCPVKKDGIWFYIGLDGLIRFNSEFVEAGNFIHGIASVRDERGVYFIDAAGNRLNDFYFDEVTPVYDSVFGAKGRGEKFWMLMHLNGDTLLQDSFYYVHASNHHFACVNRLGGYRFVDYDGNLLFGKAFNEARPFGDFFACVRLENEWYLMDKLGKFKKDIRLKEPVLLIGPMTPAISYNGKQGFLNAQGNWIYLQP